jgi:hypothetical protein
MGLLRKTDIGYFSMVVVRRIIIAFFVSAATFTIMMIRTLDSPTTCPIVILKHIGVCTLVNVD